MSKYELTDETRRQSGRTLHRIRALRDIPRHGVQAGDLGGWVESDNNLSQDGDAWIGGDACVGGNARIYDDTWIGGDARIGGDAWIYGNVWILGSSRIDGNSWIDGSAWIGGNARIGGDAWIGGNAVIDGSARIDGNARVDGEAWVSHQMHVLTATIYTTQALRATAFRQKDGSWNVRVGCLPGSIPEMRSLAESDEWVETLPEDVEEARPELLAFVALCEARAARMVL